MVSGVAGRIGPGIVLIALKVGRGSLLIRECGQLTCSLVPRESMVSWEGMMEKVTGRKQYEGENNGRELFYARLREHWSCQARVAPTEHIAGGRLKG